MISVDDVMCDVSNAHLYMISVQFFVFLVAHKEL